MTKIIPDTTSGGLMPGEHGLMVVTVRDLTRESPWGSGPTNPQTSTIAIADHCPTCLAADVVTLRGRPVGQNAHDDGVWYWVQRWANPCAHTDHYRRVVAEAADIVKRRGPGRWVRVYPTPEAETAALARLDAASAAHVRPRAWQDGHAPHELADQFVLGTARALVNQHPTPGVLEIVRHTTHRLRLAVATPERHVEYRWTHPDHPTARHPHTATEETS